MAAAVRVAIVRDGLVENVVLAPSVTTLTGPSFTALMAGAVAVRVRADQTCGPGWSYDPARHPRFEAPESD